MKKAISLALAAILLLSALSACAKPGSNGSTPPEQKDADLAAFAQTVQENHEFSGFMEKIDTEDPDMGEFMGEMLDNYYPGLTDLELEQQEIYMSMISFSSGELAMAQAKSADDAAAVKDIFQARIDAKTTEGPNNYPEEVEMWQRDAKIATQGNYVLLVCHEDSAAIVDEFNALFA